MTLAEARAPENLLLEAITGSRAYGTDTPDSDTDVKGVFVLPLDHVLGLHPPVQINNETNDIAFYELGRFVELLLKSNPGALELLCSPPECVVQRHPCLDVLSPGLFLSRQCFESFAGYAMLQIKKARGLNKKIVNPMAEQRPSVLDFCHVLEGQGSVPLAGWLQAHGILQEHCGLVAVPHMRDVYGLYHDGSGTPGFSGILSHAESTEVSLSSVPKGGQPVAWMNFNKDGFKKHCKDWRAYWDWVKERNDARYASTIAHGKNYDAKNLMHTFRLLEQARQIAREGILEVRTRQRDFLMRIRAGEFEYDTLLRMAETQLAELEHEFATSKLPMNPNEAQAEATLVEMRHRWYAL